MLAPSDRLRGGGGGGWLVLIGGGEFSFGETSEADAAWLAKVADGPIAFLPTASASADYATHFSTYVSDTLEREPLTVPIYRGRDARRGKNLERIGRAGAVYFGGGISDTLLEVLTDSPAQEALEAKVKSGGVLVGIAAAAQAFGGRCRSLTGRDELPGFSWLPRTAVEVNFDPAHDRRVRQLLEAPGMRWGLGLPSGSAVLFGSGEEIETVGPVFLLDGADDDWKLLHSEPDR